MHDIERELIKATGYKPARKFSDRNDYLGSILNATSKLSDEDFMELSDDAADWINAATASQNAKDHELPDFDEVAPPDEEGDSDSDSDAEDSSDEGGDDPEMDETTGEIHVAEPEVNDEPELPLPKVKHKIPKPVKAEPKVPAKKRPLPGRNEDVTLDKWGSIEGSKNSKALALFEKGATAKEVKDLLGGTYYNILGKAKENGHKLEKEGSLIKLTHKDDLGKKSGPAAKPTPKKKGK